MEPTVVTIGVKRFVGLTTRTTNLDEADEVTAKIPAVWSTFWNDKELQSAKKSNAFGVYSDYESDVYGEYNLTACIEINDSEEFDLPYKKITTDEQKYLCFKTKGQFPEAIVNLWKQIWEYLVRPESFYKRAYTVDFEKYVSEDEVEVYISIKD